MTRLSNRSMMFGATRTVPKASGSGFPRSEDWKMRSVPFWEVPPPLFWCGCVDLGTGTTGGGTSGAPGSPPGSTRRAISDRPFRRWDVHEPAEVDEVPELGVAVALRPRAARVHRERV